MIRQLAFVLTAFASLVGASAEQPPQPPSNAAALGSLSSGSSARQPFAQSCTQYYPALSRSQGEEGEVTVGYDITAEGATRNLTILKSSGIDRLDRAAITCAAGWQLPLVLKDGAAIFSTGHQATIRFQLYQLASPDMAARLPVPPKPLQPADPSITPTRGIGRTHDCLSYFPRGAMQPGESGYVLIGYDVGADGAISNVKLLQSSGFDILDQAALTCVREKWRNEPATKDGLPIASPGRESAIAFSFH